MHFQTDQKHPKNFYASSPPTTEDEIVVVVAHGDRCFPRQRYRDSALSVEARARRGDLRHVELATQFAGKGKNVRDEFDRHGVHDVPRERPSVAHARSLPFRLASSTGRAGFAREDGEGRPPSPPRVRRVSVRSAVEDASPFARTSPEDALEAMRRRRDARRGKAILVVEDVDKKRETPEVSDDDGDDDDDSCPRLDVDDRNDDGVDDDGRFVEGERVVTPRSRLSDSPRSRTPESPRTTTRRTPRSARSSMSSMSSKSPRAISRFSPVVRASTTTTTTPRGDSPRSTDDAATARGDRLVASMRRLGVCSPIATVATVDRDDDKRDVPGRTTTPMAIRPMAIRPTATTDASPPATSTPTTPYGGSPTTLSRSFGIEDLSPSLDASALGRARPRVPAVHHTADEWRETFGDEDLLHYLSLTKRNGGDADDDDSLASLLVVPRFRVVTWKDLAEEDDARLMRLRREYDWAQDAPPPPPSSSPSTLVPTPRSREEDACLFPRVGESVRVPLRDPTRGFSASLNTLARLTEATVAIDEDDEDVARRGIALSVVDGKIRERDVVFVEGGDARSVILRAFPGTTRVFDATASGTEPRGPPAFIAATWSRGRPVFWALGSSCVFYVDDDEHKRPTTIRANFDFSSYVVPVGERFEVRGKLVDAPEDDDAVFRPTSLHAEAFSCRVTRRRAYSNKRRLDLALAPPFAKRPLESPTAPRDRREKRDETTVDFLTCRDFVSRLMQTYAPPLSHHRRHHRRSRDDLDDLDDLDDAPEGDETWSDDLTGEVWDPINGPLVWLALTLGEEDLRDVARTYRGEVERFARILLRSPWIRTKNECDARAGKCVPLGMTTDFVEMEAGFDDSVNAWKTSLGLRSFAEWHHLPVSDCTFSACVPRQSKLVTEACGHDASYHFHEIRRCECNRQFIRVCVCEDGASVKTSLCPKCVGYAQNAYEKIPWVCEECDDRTPTSRVPRRVPLSRRRAVMYSKCGHPDCVRDRRRITFECSCGRGSALAGKTKERIAEYVDDVQDVDGIVFTEFRVVVLADESDDTARAATGRIARIVRETANGRVGRSDLAVRISRGVGTAKTANDAAIDAETGCGRVDFVIFATSDSSRDDAAELTSRRVFAYDARPDDTDDAADASRGCDADLRDALIDVLRERRVARSDDEDDEDFFRDGRDGGVLRARESRSARAASRPYESYALNSEWRVESFTWTSLFGTHVAGQKHERCLHEDCSLDGSWPVGVVGADRTCTACGVRDGPTGEHDESVNAELAPPPPKKREDRAFRDLRREDAHTVLRLVLREYY